MSSEESQYLIEFGKSLKYMRVEALKKSLRVLAYETDVPRSTLSRIENGQRPLNIIILKRLALGFNMSTDEFLKQIEKNIPEKIKNFDV